MQNQKFPWHYLWFKYPEDVWQSVHIGRLSRIWPILEWIQTIKGTRPLWRILHQQGKLVYSDPSNFLPLSSFSPIQGPHSPLSRIRFAEAPSMLLPLWMQFRLIDDPYLLPRLACSSKKRFLYFIDTIPTCAMISWSQKFPPKSALRVARDFSILNIASRLNGKVSNYIIRQQIWL